MSTKAVVAIVAMLCVTAIIVALILQPEDDKPTFEEQCRDPRVTVC